MHAVNRSIVPKLLDGKVVCSSKSLTRSVANCTWLQLRISKVPVLCITLYYVIKYERKDLYHDFVQMDAEIFSISLKGN